MISIELKAIENHCKNQERIIEDLKDIIQKKDKEIKVLKELIKEFGGN